jgi:methionyl-tRNA formyltransferase
MKKIVLLGHGVGVKLIIQTLRENVELNSDVVGVVTHPYEGHKRDLEMINYRKDLYGNFAYNVFNVFDDFGIEIIESNNVNDDYTVDWINEKCPDFIISVGCRNIINKFFLGSFLNKVFNIHTTPLPKYRGGASDTWMILNGEWENELFGCFHEIDEGIDTGKIIAKSNYKIKKNSYPIDVYKTRMSIFPELISKALKSLNSDKIIYEIQNNDEATTFPRLNTPLDGKINFKEMNGFEIEKVIYGFGYPFEGAHCYLEEKKINILCAQFVPAQGFHSLALGLIFGKNYNNEYKVSVLNGYILINKIEIEGKPTLQNVIFRLGKKLK